MQNTTCLHCAASRANGDSRCPYCGRAHRIGRQPSDDERWETSYEARMQRLERTESAHRSDEAVDAEVLAAARRLQPAGRTFVWVDLMHTGMSVCALKHALERLCERGIARVVGRAKIRPCRWRPVFKLLAAADARASDGHGPPRVDRTAATKELAPSFEVSAATVVVVPEAPRAPAAPKPVAPPAPAAPADPDTAPAPPP